MAAGNDIADPYLDDIAAAKLAVDREIKQCSVTQPPVLVQPKTYCPDLLRLKRTFGSHQPTVVPGAKLLERWIER